MNLVDNDIGSVVVASVAVAFVVAVVGKKDE